MPFALGDFPIRSIAMPVLAAGDQGYDATVMLRALFEAAVHWFGAGLPVQTIKIVIYDAGLVDRLLEVFAQLGATLPERNSQRVQRQDSYHFFMSYAHEDSLKVDVLVKGIKRENPSLAVFVDKLELNPGESWQVELDRALESSRRVIPVYSPSYMQSKMCIEEFNMARLRHRQSKVPVLTPVYLRDAALPLYMQTLQYLDCRPGDDDGLLLRTSATLAAIPFTAAS
jgi:hypothetical protein